MATGYGDFVSSNLLIATDIQSDNSPVSITKDLASSALNIASKLQVDNGIANLDGLQDNQVPSAKNVKDALQIFSTTDSSTLATLQSIQSEFQSGGDVAVAINNIATQSNQISDLQSEKDIHKGRLDSLDSSVSSLSSSVSLVSSLAANVVSVSAPLGGIGPGTISIGSSGPTLTWNVRYRN